MLPTTVKMNDVADAVERLETDNAQATAPFMHPRTWPVFRELKDSNSRYQLQPDPTAESRRSLFRVPVYTSSQISITEKKGTSTDCSYILAFDMSQIVVGRRQAVDIRMSEDDAFNKDQTYLRVVSRWDIQTVNEEGIELVSGLRG